MLEALRVQVGDRAVGTVPRSRRREHAPVTPQTIRVEDRLAIDALVTECAWRLDHQRTRDLAALFTTDATYTFRGREAGVTAWADGLARLSERKTIHQVTNLRLTPTGPDRVAGVAALVLHAVTNVGTYVDLVGEYRDEYVRTPAGWRFARRELVRLQDV